MSLSQLSNEVLLRIGHHILQPQLHPSFTLLHQPVEELRSAKSLSSLVSTSRRFQTLFTPILYINLFLTDQDLGSILSTLSTQPSLAYHVKLLRLMGSKVDPTPKETDDSASNCKKYMRDTNKFTLARDSKLLFDLAKAKLLDAFPNLKVLIMKSETLTDDYDPLTLGFAPFDQRRQFGSILNCEFITLHGIPFTTTTATIQAQDDDEEGGGGGRLPIQVRKGLSLNLLSHFMLLPNLISLEGCNVNAGPTTFNLQRFQGLSKVKHLRLEDVYDPNSKSHALQAFRKLPRFLLTALLLPNNSEVFFSNHAVQLALGLEPSRSVLQTLIIPLGFFPMHDTYQEREALANAGPLQGPIDYGFLRSFYNLKFLAMVEVTSSFQRREAARPFELLCHLLTPSTIFRINISKERLTGQDLELLSLYFKMGWITSENKPTQLQLFGSMDDDTQDDLFKLYCEARKVGTTLFYAEIEVEFDFGHQIAHQEPHQELQPHFSHFDSNYGTGGSESQFWEKEEKSGEGGLRLREESGVKIEES